MGSPNAFDGSGLNLKQDKASQIQPAAENGSSAAVAAGISYG